MRTRHTRQRRTDATTRSNNKEQHPRQTKRKDKAKESQRKPNRSSPTNKNCPEDTHSLTSANHIHLFVVYGCRSRMTARYRCTTRNACCEVPAMAARSGERAMQMKRWAQPGPRPHLGGYVVDPSDNSQWGDFSGSRFGIRPVG